TGARSPSPNPSTTPLGAPAIHDRRRSGASGVGLEAVAHPRLGDEVPRPGRVGLELAPNLGHVHAQVVRLPFVLRAPYLLQQVALCEEATGVAHQLLDQSPLGGGEVDDLAVAGGARRDQIDGEVWS